MTSASKDRIPGDQRGRRFRPPNELADELGLPLPEIRQDEKNGAGIALAYRWRPPCRSSRRDPRVGSLVPVGSPSGPSPVQHTERELIREHLTRGLKEQDRLIIVALLL